jgi:hypothetical protein
MNYVTVKRLSCGCCNLGCVCANHMDYPRGLWVQVCRTHQKYECGMCGGVAEPMRRVRVDGHHVELMCDTCFSTWSSTPVSGCVRCDNEGVGHEGDHVLEW